ncbi:unnamed protein product [Linum tenue]|uniref:Uncharacterized protein n=1 Tax=Linum tenue TaxID=586396 RepID=A0AAV0R262_9ROSI|nr:unnamed protein product [Linum tenue]
MNQSETKKRPIFSSLSSSCNSQIHSSEIWRIVLFSVGCVPTRALLPDARVEMCYEEMNSKVWMYNSGLEALGKGVLDLLPQDGDASTTTTTAGRVSALTSADELMPPVSCGRCRVPPLPTPSYCRQQSASPSLMPEFENPVILEAKLKN